MGIFSSKTIVNVQSNVNKLIEAVPKRNNNILTQAILNSTPIVDATLRMNTSQMKAKVNDLVNYARSPEYIHGLPTVIKNYSTLSYPRKVGKTLFIKDPNQPYDTATHYYFYSEFRMLEWFNFGTLRTASEEAAVNEKMIYYGIIEKIRFYIYNNQAPFAGMSYDGFKIDSRRVINNQYLTFSVAPHYPTSLDGTPTPWNGYTYVATVYLDGVQVVFPAGQGNMYFDDPRSVYTIKNQMVHAYRAILVYQKVNKATNKVEGTLTTSPVTTRLLDIPFNNPFYAENALHPINLNTAVAEMTYPVIPIKYNGSYINSGNTESGQVTKALNYVNLSKDTLIKSLSENPDSNVIDDAYIMFGFRPNMIAEKEEYLAVATILDLINNHSVAYTDERNNVITFIEGEFEYNLEFKRIEQFEMPLTGTGHNKNYWTEGQKPTGATKWESVMGSDSFEMYETPIMYEHTVFEVTIPKNATTQTHFRLIGATGSFMVNTSLGKRYSVYKPNQEDFLLPLFENVLDFIPSIQQDAVLQHAMVLVTNSIQYTKVKWYQSGFFKFLLKIFAVFLIVVNPAIGSFISTVMAGGTAALYAIVQLVGMYVLSGIAVEYLISKLGKLGVLLAVGLAIATAQMSGQLSTSLDKAMKVLTSTIDSYQIYQKDLLDDVYSLDAKFTEQLDERTKQLKSLEQDIGIDWLNVSTVRQPNNLLKYETPSDFYARTSTIISMPDITYGLVNNYYTMNLTLPGG